MRTPTNDAHTKAFYWFAAGWLLAVAGSSVVAVVSGGHEWTRVARTAFSMGVMPIISASLVVASRKWLQQRL
jgi:preprotein translocase subunit SecY